MESVVCEKVSGIVQKVSYAPICQNLRIYEASQMFALRFALAS